MGLGRRVGVVALAMLGCGGVTLEGGGTAGRAAAGASEPNEPDERQPQPVAVGGAKTIGGATAAGGSEPALGGAPVSEPPDRGPPINFEGSVLRDYVYTRIDGEAQGVLSGGTILGDLDQDGYDELLLSDFGGSGPPASIDAGTRGATYLFYGRPHFPARLSALDADLVIRGGSESPSAAPLGDVDGDGFDDCGFVSNCDCSSLGSEAASCTCPQTSGLHLLFGGAKRASGVALANEVSVTFPGAAYIVRPAGDVNGDGFDDVLVGVSTKPGQFGIFGPEMRLMLGGPGLRRGRSLALADARFVGATQDDSSGSGVGDIDGDGFDDLLLGGADAALYYGGRGRFTGSLERKDADATFDHPASWYLLQPAGDLDGDGFADLAIPSYADVALYYGRAQRFSGSVSADWRDGSARAYTGAMEGFAIGDIDHDGARELLIGDPKEQTHGFQSGALFLLPGSLERLAHDYTLGTEQVVMYGADSGEATADFSYGTSSGGDVNGDGYDDIIAGQPTNGIGDEDGGQAILILGGALQH